MAFAAALLLFIAHISVVIAGDDDWESPVYTREFAMVVSVLLDAVLNVLRHLFRDLPEAATDPSYRSAQDDLHQLVDWQGDRLL